MFNLTEVLVLFKVKLKNAASYLTSSSRDRVVRLMGYIVVISIFLVGGYTFFYRMFAYLYTVELIGGILVSRILDMAFLVFLTMLFMSNIVTSLSTLYRSREVNFLMSLPVESDSIFVMKSVENLAYSSWATLIAGLPIIVSFGTAAHAPFHFYPVSIVAFLLFAFIPAGFGITVLMLLAAAFPRISKREIVLILIFLFLAAALLYLTVGRPEGITRLPFTTNLHELDSYLETLGALSSPFLPGAWLSSTMTSLSEGSTSGAVFHFSLLLSTAVFSIALSMGVASRLYRKTWTTARDSGGMRRSRVRRDGEPKSFIPGIFGIQRTALVEKDLKLFFRDAAQWSQAAILLGLLAVYVLSLRRTPIYFTTPFWRNLISLVNLGFTGYVFATVSIRFVYPAISLEGQALWVVRSSPLSIRDLFWGKLILNLVLGTVLVEAIILSSDLLLKVDPIVTVISMVAVLFFACSLVSIAIGFGAGMPDLKESNPSKIASGPGGILAAMTSLAYVGMSVTIMAWPGYAYLVSEMNNTSLPRLPFAASGAAFLLLNGLAIWLPLYLGIRSLASREI